MQTASNPKQQEQQCFSLPLCSLSSGGIAYLDAPSVPVGVVENRSYRYYYAFGHEVSHLLGATHDVDTLDGKTPPYSYGVGNRIEGTRKHTIMA